MGHLLQQVSFFMFNIPQSVQGFKRFLPVAVSGGTDSAAPRPLIRGDTYQMDDELATLLIEAHRNIGFLEGLVKYAPIIQFQKPFVYCKDMI